MRKFIVLTAVALLAATAVSAEASEPGFKGARLAPMATVTLAAARTTALAARPGVITDQELESEKGGTGLRYSFDIKTAAGTQEVGVDAASGTVLENAKEGPNPD